MYADKEHQESLRNSEPKELRAIFELCQQRRAEAAERKRRCDTRSDTGSSTSGDRSEARERRQNGQQRKRERKRGHVWQHRQYKRRK